MTEAKRYSSASPVLLMAEAICGLAVAITGLIGLIAAASWIFDGDVSLARILLTAAFVGGAGANFVGVMIHIGRRNDLGLLLIWAAFPVLAITTAVFVGAFASWSPFFVPIVPLALLTSAFAYLSSR